MGGLARRLGISLALAGFDPRATLRAIQGFPRFVHDRREFARLSREQGLPVPRLRDTVAALGDATDAAGTTGEYFLGDLWTARRIMARRPDRHVDLGSRIDGLVAHLLTFMDVQVVDIRPLTSNVDGLHFIQADGESLSGIRAPSVSSIHAIEHFGLGRYGDPLDPRGHMTAIQALASAVTPGGDLYLGFPVGRERIEFNAHRVLDPLTPIDLLPGFELQAFAAVVDGAVQEAEPDSVRALPYALGLYHFARSR